MDDQIAFGRQLRQLRKTHDLTQEALAQLAYCAIDTIRKIEAGVRRPSRQMAEQFADCLDLAGDTRAAFLAAARTGPLAGVAAPGGALERLDLPTPSRPTGTVTFLYTDIEDSAALAQHYPAALPKLLIRHHAILRQSIEAHRGYIFQITGDAFCAAFHTAADAVHAAIQAQRHLQAEPWQPAAVNVRMGVHTGTAEAGASEDIAGGYDGYLTLTRVQRVMSAARGGQVLLSNASAELMRGQLSEDITLRDLGEYHLKGLLAPERVWQVAAVDLWSDFPPLRARSAIRNNLPLQLSSFIGREKEITDVQQLLMATRLLTLTGVGGTGKTRLALQVASTVADTFRDGAWFIDLAPIGDPTRVVPTIAHTLGLREAAGTTIDELLTAYLREKQLLLVLDNFEQVIDAAPAVKGLLTMAPRVSVLVTSRALLRIAGEREYTVPLLGVPDTHGVPSPELLTTYEAVRLFIERAQAVKAGFTVTAENAPAIAAICVRLEGLPLAIELAAARVRVLPPQKLLLLLQRRLQVLISSARDLPARQQTLRGAIDWSYGLLTIGEQTLFRRLAVFVGGAALEAIMTICDLDGTTDVLGGVESLVDKSLLKANDNQGEPRFTMLETVREYAMEQLAGHREDEMLRQRHAEYYLTLAEAAEPELLRSRQLVWMERLETEHDNLRAALGRALERDNAMLGLRLAGALGWFWNIRGYFSEGRRWLEALLALPASSTVAATVRAKALSMFASLALDQGDLALTRSLVLESLTLFREMGDKRGIAYSLGLLGWIMISERNLEEARALFEEDAAICRQIQDTGYLAAALWGLGATVMRDDIAAARPIIEESVALFREVGNKAWLIGALNQLGVVAWLEGDYAQAGRLFEEGIALCHELQERNYLPGLLGNLGDMARYLGDEHRAAALYEESLSLAWQKEDTQQIAQNLMGLAGLAGAAGRAERATRLLSAAQVFLLSLDLTVDVLPPNNRDDFKRTADICRAALGEEGFAAAWTAGLALTMEQAIAYALEDMPTSDTGVGLTTQPLS